MGHIPKYGQRCGIIDRRPSKRLKDLSLAYAFTFASALLVGVSSILNKFRTCAFYLRDFGFVFFRGRGEYTDNMEA